MRATIPSFIPPHESFTLKESALPLPHLLLTPVLLTHHHQPEALIFLTSFSLLLFLIPISKSSNCTTKIKENATIGSGMFCLFILSEVVGAGGCFLHLSTSQRHLPV